MVLRAFLVGVGYTVPVGLTFFHAVGYVAHVDGFSMQPTLNPRHKRTRDTVWLNRWSVRKHQYKRGEIISLVDPQDPGELLIKRIIALPGDCVQTLDYKDSYVNIPEGHMWVEGDNHGNSKDSNQFGPIPMGLVHSKAQYIVWPVSRWQRLKENFPKERTIRIKPLDTDEPGHLRDDVSNQIVNAQALDPLADLTTEVSTQIVPKTSPERQGPVVEALVNSSDTRESSVSVEEYRDSHTHRAS